MFPKKVTDRNEVHCTLYANSRMI